jgi:hypothetical protein
MCRNIRVLYNFEPPSTDDDIRAAASQYVRKVSGFAKPSAANERAFSRAVEDVARATSTLLESLVTTAPRETGPSSWRGHTSARSGDSESDLANGA